MNFINLKVDRKTVVKYYARRESEKKGYATINWTDCDWDNANDIDSHLQSVEGYKHGIISGYKTWQLIELNLNDLKQCAIVTDIFPGQSRVLGNLINTNAFNSWKPDRDTEWYDSLEAGEPFIPEWKMIMRPRVASEKPAKWYMEDGSGRAICFTRYLHNNNDLKSLAVAYLGVEADKNSNFLNNNYEELVTKNDQ